MEGERGRRQEPTIIQEARTYYHTGGKNLLSYRILQKLNNILYLLLFVLYFIIIILIIIIIIIYKDEDNL